jgi:ABC-type transport system involved in multi-copper enzyme maturation permease subunit
MLKNIIKKEIQETITSPKFVFTFLLCTVLILLSVFTGITAYRAEQKEYSAAIALNKKNLESANDYQILGYTGIKINRPPQVMSSIVSGVSEAVGRVATVNYTNDPSLFDSKYESSPVFSIFGALDLTFIVKIVLSLFAILFTYDVIVGEKERGTLRLILSNEVPRDRLLMGKVVGGYISLLISLIIPLILGMLILLIYPNISMSGQDWVRVLIMFLIFFLYLSVFFTLGLLVSARTNKSSTSFLVLLFIWVIFVTVIPKVSILAAAQLNPIPSVHEITAKKDAFLQQVQEESIKRYQDWGKEHRPKTVEEENRYPEDFKKNTNEIQQWGTAQIDNYNAALERDYQARKRSQETLAINLSRISPASALMFSTMSLARTGLDEHDRFLASLRAYKSMFANWINAQSMKNFKFDRARGDRPKVDLADMPQHKFEPESLSKSLARTLPDIGLMFVLIIVFFAGAYVSFLKYDVR